MTMKAIEAGARAKSFVTDEMVRTALNACGRAYDVQYNVLWMRRALEAAIASGELVPASGEYVLVPREATAAMCEAARTEDELVKEQGFGGAEYGALYAAMLTAATSNGSGK